MFFFQLARWINEVVDVEEQLLQRINELLWYTIQVNEFTGVNNKTILLVFVWYIFQENVYKDLLHALFLLTPQLQNYSNPWIIIYWEDLIGHFISMICMDGMAAITGRLSDLTTQIKEVVSECESTCCVIHRKMLASQKMLPELNRVLQDVINFINIKVHVFNSHLFEQLWEEMDAEHRSFLMYTEVKWLSKGSCEFLS